MIAHPLSIPPIKSRPGQKRRAKTFAPVVAGLEERVMMASRPAAVAVAVKADPITFVTDESKFDTLTAKRVPGYLAGWKDNDSLSAPFSHINEPGRSIDDKTEDYWAVTLNQYDTVALSITVPNTQGPIKGFTVRMWGPGPNYQEINKAVETDTFAYVATQDGTYILAVSTTANAAYTFAPNAAQTKPTGGKPFNLVFDTIPGPKTNLIDVLKSYPNTTNNWPAWKTGEQPAYETLRAMALKGKQAGIAELKNFSGGFRTVKVSDPVVLKGWLNATWTPLQKLLDGSTPEQLYDKRAYPIVNAYWPKKSDWVSFARGFLQNPDPFQSVYETLNDANQSRQAVRRFLDDFQKWLQQYEINLIGDALEIANIMQTGLRNPKDTAQLNPLNEADWQKGLFDWGARSLQAFCTSAGAFIGFLVTAGEGGIGQPIGAQIGALIGGQIGAATAATLVNAIEPLTNAGTKVIPAPNLYKLAQNMNDNLLDTYNQRVGLLLNADFIEGLFSNYALLKALGRIQFTSPAVTPAPKTSVKATAAGGVRTLGIPLPKPGDPWESLRTSYRTAAWEQLLPRMFKWENAAFTDTSSFRGFVNFVPSTESAKWIEPGPINHDQSWTNNNHAADAKALLQNLQGGAKFQFAGYDFTGNNDFGPGPISGPQSLQGDPSEFYTITPNTRIDFNPLNRIQGSSNRSGLTKLFRKTTATVRGNSIQEWRLVSRDGGKVISRDAADILFGTGPLQFASNDPISDPDTKSSSYTYRFKLQAGGLATRHRVFTQWGKGTDFAPASFKPAKGSSGKMDIGLNPNNKYTAKGGEWVGKFLSAQANYTISYE